MRDSNQPGGSTFSAAIQEALQQLKKRRAGYWIRLIIVVIVVEYLVDAMDQKGIGSTYRYQFYA